MQEYMSMHCHLPVKKLHADFIFRIFCMQICSSERAAHSLCVCVFVCVHVCVGVCQCVCAHVCVTECMFVHECDHVCARVCVCLVC